MYVLDQKEEKYVLLCEPHFFYIKVGFKGVYISRTCFPDGMLIKLLVFLAPILTCSQRMAINLLNQNACILSMHFNDTLLTYTILNVSCYLQIMTSFLSQCCFPACSSKWLTPV